MIEIKNIEKSYGTNENKLKVLKGINLNIKDGEFVVILGASGSGKSTLMNIISGLEKMDNGNVVYDGVDISGYDEKELTRFRKDNVGFIFQQYYLLPNLTVSQNVKMGADLSNNKDYMSIIEKVGLKEKYNKFPSQLSGGEMQRVAIARAIAKNSKYLFMDEPTGALDEETGRLVLDYISKIHKENRLTLIMVTHNANIAMMANTIININSGKIVSVKTNEHCMSAYEIGW